MSKRTAIEQGRARLLQGIGVPEKSEFVADEFQSEAIRHSAYGDDVLVVAPTGSGKTYIAFQAMEAALAQGRRAVYTTPLKALSNTKFNELKIRFEPQYKVGLLTGDRKIDGDSQCVVATTEIYRNELYRGSDKSSLVVLDEVHFIADPQRGPVWEESIILTPKSSSLLMLSASISNAREIADWISEVRGRECQIVTKKERPVEIRYGFLHPELGVVPLRDEKGGIFNEVLHYYGSSVLDKEGLRLRGGDFNRGGNDQHRGYRGRR
jgi:ATP-dependent RNA helicase HelY